MEGYFGNMIKLIRRWWMNKEGFLSFLFYFSLLFYLNDFCSAL
jgi:hypothetical protein